MVREEKIMDDVVARYRLGTGLVWLGVLVWVPFILLRLVGEKPQFLWFLPFHLLGVLGGARIRSIARKELGLTQPTTNTLHKIGHGLIFLGILVWLPYFYQKLVAGLAVEVMDFLPFHLTGVLGGIALHIISYVNRRFSAKKD